ncbi:MAG: FHIPEP family type III secretion protein, partial [Pseudomonadota bacterium]
HVRRRLAFLVIARLTDGNGRLPLIQLDDAWETRFADVERPSEDGGPADIALTPADFDRLAAGVRAVLAEPARRGLHPAIVTSARRRRFLREVLVAKGISAPVLSFEEIGTRTELLLVGTVAP